MTTDSLAEIEKYDLFKRITHKKNFFFIISVLKSEPMLDNLVDLENRLNETNDLSGFVTKIRIQFQRYSLTNV